MTATPSTEAEQKPGAEQKIVTKRAGARKEAFAAAGFLAHHLADPALRHVEALRRLLDVGAPGIMRGPWRVV